jgi:hypothetical protein
MKFTLRDPGSLPSLGNFLIRGHWKSTCVQMCLYFTVSHLEGAENDRWNVLLRIPVNELESVKNA